MRIRFLILSTLMSAGLFLTSADTMDDSLQSLKDAVAKKDAAQIKTLATQTYDEASKVAAGPAETEIDKDKVNEAKETQNYVEYALYTSAIEAETPTKIDLFQTLEQVNPKSKFLEDGYLYYFQALTDAGDAAKVPGIAEKALKSLPNSPDVLAELMNLAAQKNQSGAAATYAQRLIAALAKRPKSEVIPEAEWVKKKSGMLGRAHMINGLTLVAQDKNYRADQELRVALPLASDDVQKAAILFNLALANYNLGRVGLNKGQILEAVKFSQQCAAINGQYQALCSKNVTAMKTYAASMH